MPGSPRCHICATCGVQFSPSADAPQRCPICEDERQYVGWGGQRWTTLEELRLKHHNDLRDDMGLVGVGIEPSFAIGQRALLVRSPEGNLLWDCITVIDDATINAVRDLGGIRAIAISHPHYYASMVEWAHTFGCPIYLHEAERKWVMRPDPAIRFWDGETNDLGGGLTLVRCGGHYEGGQVLHWAQRKALLSGDIVHVIPDRRYVSFMYSYPNLIPLPPSKVKHIADALVPFPFDTIYGAWFDRVIERDGSAVVRRSVDRYIRAVTEPGLPS